MINKHLFIKLVCFASIVSILSCSKEMYEEPAFNEKFANIHMQKISLKNLNAAVIDPKVFRAVNKVKSKQKVDGQHNRMVYDLVYNFYYDDENGVLIEQGNYKSYTFQVIRPDGSDKVENIVFSKNENDTDYDTYLFKYDFTNQELQTESTAQLSSKAVTIKNLELQNDYPTVFPGDWGELAQGKSVFVPKPCRWVKVSTEHGGGHWECIDGSGGLVIVNIPPVVTHGQSSTVPSYLNPAPVVPGTPIPSATPVVITTTNTTSTSTTSTNTSTTSSNTSTSTTSSSGGYSQGSGVSNSNQAGGAGSSIITSPMGGGDNSAGNPCKKFRKQKEELPALQQALINLEATKTQNHENGIFVDSNSPNIQNATPSTTASSTVDFPNLSPPNKYKIMAHTHDAYGPYGTGTFSIFSWGDLLQAADIVKENEFDDDFLTLYLATADGTRYALTIDWPSAFYQVFDINTNPNNPSQTNYFNSDKFQELYKIENKYYSEIPTSGKISYNSTPEDDLKVFLKMMKELKLNISLFEVDPTYTTFSKLTLNSDATVKRGNPCN